jgi:hypothetical protein
MFGVNMYGIPKYGSMSTASRWCGKLKQKARIVSIAERKLGDRLEIGGWDQIRNSHNAAVHNKHRVHAAANNTINNKHRVAHGASHPKIQEFICYSTQQNKRVRTPQLS